MHLLQQQILIVLLAILCIGQLDAQSTLTKDPLSWNKNFQNKYPLAESARHQFPPFDLEKLKTEDNSNPGTRFAAPMPVDIGFKDGEWQELPNGDRIWRVKIEVPNALGLLFFYDTFYLPPGSLLWMFSEDNSADKVQYQYKDNPPNGQFFTGVITGNSAWLEYYEPKANKGQGLFHLFRVDYVYQSDNFRQFNEFEFGASLDCQINVNCTQGEDWQEEKQGVCRIILVVEEGTGYCSGSLMNNTNRDKTPYILSAFHCQDGYTPLYDLWRFDFRYEAATCENPETEPAFNSIMGSTFRAGRRDNDFLLVEINDTIPDDIPVYFNGWSRSAEPPLTSISIHHPRGDIQKISMENDPAIIFQAPINWNNGTVTPPNHHFRVSYDEGTFEIGSSGSPLLDPEGLVVGQLHGGNADCDNITAYFGRFRLSWIGGGFPENRLMDWLDPIGTAPDSLHGLAHSIVDTASIGGYVLTPAGVGIAGVNITLSAEGIVPVEMQTDVNGFYKFSGLLLGLNYSIGLSKEGNAVNGVSTLDLINIRKHIINLEPFETPYQLLASDANASASISTFDLIQVRKIILGIDTAFSDQPSWQFYPENFNFTDPLNPFLDSFPTSFTLATFTNTVNDFNFTGVKTGDVNNSADPGN